MRRKALSEPQWERRSHPLVAAIPEAFWRDPESVLGTEGACLKRSGHHRDTSVLVVPGGNVLVKHCHLSTLRERVAYRLGCTALQREWRVLCHLEQLNGIAPQPIACGWQRRGGEWHGWLLAEFVKDTVTFDTQDPPRELGVLYPAARALARAVAHLHAANVTHGDLHSGNLLFNPHTGTWHIADFSQARIGRAHRAALVHDLVQLQHCLGKKVPMKVRVAFLTEYLASFARLTGTSDELTGREWRWLWSEIWRKSVQYSVTQAAERNERCVRATRELAPLAEWLDEPLAARAPFGFTVRTLSRSVVNDLVNDVLSETWYLQAHVTLLRNTPQRVAGVWAHPQGRVVITELREPAQWWLRVLTRLRDGDPLAAWRASWRLHALHVGTPAPLLLVRLPRRVILVHEYDDAHVSLQALLHAPSLPPQLPPRPQLVRAVALAVAVLHDRGVAHGSLVPANIHVAPSRHGGVDVLFTGLWNARFYRQLPWRRRIADLVQLYSATYHFVTGSERRAFLRIYRAALSQPCDVRQLLFSVWEASQA